MNGRKRRVGILFVLAALIVLLQTAFAVQVTSGSFGEGLTWTLSEEGTLTISGTGAMPDYGSYSVVPWYEH